MELSPTLVFDYPSGAALAEHVLGLLPPQPPAASEQPADEPITGQPAGESCHRSGCSLNPYLYQNFEPCTAC